MEAFTRWKIRARALQQETVALFLAVKHPGTPWYAKVLALCVVAYALSPIDLIPDPIPILGHLDDFVLVPLGVALVCWLIPSPVLAECRAAAAGSKLSANTWARWVVLFVIVSLWLAVIGVCVRWVWLRREQG